MLHDVRFALRRLRRAPATVLFTVATLALGIGTTTAVFSAIDSLLWRPLGIPEPATLQLISRTNMMRPGPASVSIADFRAIRDDAGALGASTIAGWSPFTATFAGDGGATIGLGEFVSADYFALLGIAPRLGRLLEPGDDAAGASSVAVLSSAAWRAAFHADPDIVGRRISIAKLSFTVVGVTPDTFRGVHEQGLAFPVGWITMAQAPVVLEALRWRHPAISTLTVGLRLPPQATVGPTRAALTELEKVRDAAAPLDPIVVRGQPPIPVQRNWTTVDITDDAAISAGSEVGRLVIALPGLVMLIVCTNIANLVFSRGASRRQDFGVRRALGATRWQLIREQLVEQGLVAVVGGVGAVGVAFALIEAGRRFAARELAPFTSGMPLGWEVGSAVVSAAIVSVVIAVFICGFVPALHLTRDSLRTVMAQGDGVSTPRWRGRGNLIALQLGISVGLFLVAIVFVRIMMHSDNSGQSKSLTDRLRTAPVVDASFARLAIADVPLDEQGRTDDEVDRYVTTAIRRAADRDGTAVAVTSDGSLLAHGAAALRLRPSYLHATIPHMRVTARDPDLHPALAAVSANYFAVVGLALRGRALRDDDTNGVVVSQRLAEHLFQSSNVVGRDFPLAIGYFGAPAPEVEGTATIVGVTPDTAETAGPASDGMVYISRRRIHARDLTFLATSSGAPPVETLAAALHDADPEMAVNFVTTGAVVVGGLFAFARGIALTLTGLAVFALAVATVGLYGVMSHVFARRTREMGLRLALGATPRAIVTLVLRDGFRPIAEGLFIGLATATVIRVFMMRTMSGDVAPFNLVECLVCVVLLSVAGAMACWLPARRASTVAPNVALRSL
jgi:predicted permease